MAELAIPLIVLGGLYVVSNQDKKEKFENRTTNYLPNTQLLPENYPTTTEVKDSNIKKYPNANQTTDKFFDASVYQKTAEQKMGDSANRPQIFSLTGDVINTTDFDHNNMVPFFGSKIKGATLDANTSEAFLDNMQGTGSQQIKKKECAPMFTPEENMQWQNGMPSTSDFFQSRVNPSSRMANIKPWEEIKVAPGVGKGFNTQGSDGFNSGMENRDQWMPRNVDELRTETNPKLSFGLQGHEGPANAYIKNSATQETQGAVEKYLPDKFYAQGPERWLTTTGLEKGETLRALEIMQDVNRTSTTQQYFGSSGVDSGATYTTGEYEKVHRTQDSQKPITNAMAAGQHSVKAGDYGMESYANAPNNRSTTSNASEYGFLNGIMKAVVAPIVDVLRPTRKTNVIGNIRPQGNVNGGQKTHPVYNPADRTSTTNRQMFADSLDCNHLNVQGQVNNAYQVSEQQSVANQRDVTTCSYTGDASGDARPRTYNAEYNQRNNDNKIQNGRISSGGTQIFNQYDNISINKRDDDRRSARGNISVGGPTETTSTEIYGKIHMPQYYNECTNCDRIQPDILDAFKNNPYTQSLNSWA
jgi:hypothetical protein